ncbi:preprotein translocase subunit SecE, partial [candidate division WWE3 bacterium CG08_land_8_20_14_0_20_41_15]
MKRLVDFMNEVKVELRKVSWPTRKQAVKYTGMVILVSFALGIFIGLIDYGLTRALTYIIK